MKLRLFFLHLTLLLLCFGTATYAQSPSDDEYYDMEDNVEEGYSVNRNERVVSYNVYLDLDKDNYMEVTECIRIYAAGNVFKRGLRRVIPQKRTDIYGHNKSMPIHVQAIECDGEKAPWHYDIDEDDNYIIYIGDPDKYLEEGEYEYTITYIAPGHIGQFEDHDEIFWNLNGFDWAVPFDTLAAAVYIPEGTSIKKYYAYTGAKGAKGNDYEAGEDEEDGAVVFLNTRPFNGGENMSVVVEFSKGSQAANTWWQTWGDDVYAGLTALGFFLFCFFSWLRKGVDPKMPTIVPQYTVPEGISAALAGRIMDASEDKRVIASLMSLMIKGGALIKKVTKDDYQIIKGTNNEKLDEFDSCVQERLFQSKDQVRTDVDYDDITGVKSALDKVVSSKFDDDLYVFNSGSICIATLLACLGGYFIFSRLEALDWVTYSVVAILIVVLIWYFCVIGKYTGKGIEMRAQMEGLKMYITTAEKLRMRDMTPEHFEDLLPYAVAFGVEVAWCKQFEDVLKKFNYRPTWYDTSSAYSYSSLFNSSHGISSITQGFAKATQGSFEAYDRAHSSDSGGSWGGGSGGSSGGGGGGGGGGGW